MPFAFADTLPLPDGAETETFAFVGKRGSGKTYGALKLAELFLEAKIPIVALDPVGKWWALRLAADGKGRGFDVPVLGGHRGDLPLEPGAGALLADVVADRRTSLVLDMSLMTQGELKQFARDFGERLLHRKKGEPQASPVHLFIEEAQELVPEYSRGDVERMKAAYVRIVKLGRNWGMGATLITQRPQAVTKEALNQTECVVALQTVGAHERKALRDWIAHHGEQVKLVDELPGLQSGQAYVWSPAWLQVLKKVKIRKRVTFDASATPTMKSAEKLRAAKPLGPVDLEALRASMAATIERAKADDPKELRKRIAELEKQVAAKPHGLSAVDRQKLIDQASAQRDETWRKFLSSDARTIARAVDELGKLRERFKSRGLLDGETPPRATAFREDPGLHAPPGHPAMRRALGRDRVAPKPLVKTPANRPPGDGLAGGERKILTVLAQYRQGRSKVQIALLAGYSHKGGGFNNYLGALRSRGYIEGSIDRTEITDVGRAALGEFERLPTGVALQEYWLGQLGKAERACLEVLIGSYPDPMTKEDVAAAAGYEPTGGGFNNALGKLRTLELIEGRGELRASDVLFQ